MSQNATAAKKAAGNEFVTITDNTTGKSYDFPLISGSLGPKVIDVRTLYGETGYFTYDPGHTSTGACESQITFTDGNQGVLLPRGSSDASRVGQESASRCRTR